MISGPPFVYTPANGYHGLDQFTYYITDSVNGDSNQATVTIAVSNRPTCSDSTGKTQMNQPLRISSFPAMTSTARTRSR
jgi:Big-like domain-containing protein